MIVSASRRTDLPAYYADWLCRRFSEGCVLVRNPFRFHQVSRIALTAETVDGIVFWTKNPLPLARRLSVFRDFPYYFQWTLTPYGRDIEPGLPDKSRLLAAFRDLAEAIGPERLVWRYDPVLLSPAWTCARHEETFARFCRALRGASDTCVVSFLDGYRHGEAFCRAMRCAHRTHPNGKRSSHPSRRAPGPAASRSARAAKRRRASRPRPASTRRASPASAACGSPRGKTGASGRAAPARRPWTSARTIPAPRAAATATPCARPAPSASPRRMRPSSARRSPPKTP